MKMHKFKVLLLFGLCLILCSGQQIKKPNIVMFLTDDQDIVMNGMSPMRNVQLYIAKDGITFTNAFVSSPICCPSRASILTGMYQHNHHTFNNSINGGCYGDFWKNNERNTFAAILQNQAGYNTFYAGKYLNQYGIKESGGPEVVPPGWSEWHGLVGNSVYYNYVMSNNGVPTHSTDLYLTDVLRDLGVSYIENQTETRPFLMVLAPPAPHAPFTPAPRHKDAFQNITLDRKPNFNIAVKDKHWLMRMPPSPLTEESVSELEQAYQNRWRTLLAVDELVADVITSLTERGLLDNTYIIYTSDNGYHIGQFSQMYDKRQPYESDIRVPLVIKGPGIPAATVGDPVMNIDLAPTILTLAGIEPPTFMDGTPIDLFRKSKEDLKERNMLLEYFGEYNVNSVDSDCPWKYDGNLSECKKEYACKCQDSRNNTFACVRHIAPRIDYKYCYFNDAENFVEMYDLTSDPYELKNVVHESMPAVKYWYQMVLFHLIKCKGSQSCNQPIPNQLQ